jgi:hypothetical protein
MTESDRRQLAQTNREKIPFQSRFAILDLIVANPFLTPRGAEKKLRLSYNTVLRAIRQLEQLKILRLANEVKR